MSDEHGRRTPREPCKSTAELEQELNEIREMAQKDEEEEALEMIVVLFLMAGSVLVGIYSTQWFGTWPAQLAGGLTIAVFVFCAVVLTLHAADKLTDRIRGDESAQ